MRPWQIYVGVFFVAWFILAFGFGYWRETLEYWRMSIVMIFGSLVAGSTPMGGGTVAFPVLVLVFGQSPDMGRNFGIVIQALGMTSAMIFILCRRVPIERRMLMWAASGSAAGLLAGTFLIEPYLSQSIVKLLFACLWLSFGGLTLARNREICGLNRIPVIQEPEGMWTGLAVGAIGGVMTSLIGVGVEMMLYTLLVLLYRCDLKAAVPTAVSAMAVASVLGMFLHVAIGDIEREVFLNWMAAGPIVVFGAPIGTYIVSVIPRIRTLYFVALLCVLQFVWAINQVAPSGGEWGFVALMLALANAGFYTLYRLGKKREAK